MQFKIGDRVKYVSRRHGDSKSNPVWNGSQGKIFGTIAEFRSGNLSLRVLWDNGCYNTYYENDLVRYNFIDDMKDLFEI